MLAKFVPMVLVHAPEQRQQRAVVGAQDKDRTASVGAVHDEVKVGYRRIIKETIDNWHHSWHQEGDVDREVDFGKAAFSFLKRIFHNFKLLELVPLLIVDEKVETLQFVDSGPNEKHHEAVLEGARHGEENEYPSVLVHLDQQADEVVLIHNFVDNHVADAFDDHDDADEHRDEVGAQSEMCHFHLSILDAHQEYHVRHECRNRHRGLKRVAQIDICDHHSRRCLLL